MGEPMGVSSAMLALAAAFGIGVLACCSPATQAPQPGTPSAPRAQAGELVSSSAASSDAARGTRQMTRLERLIAARDEVERLRRRYVSDRALESISAQLEYLIGLERREITDTS